MSTLGHSKILSGGKWWRSFRTEGEWCVILRGMACATVLPCQLPGTRGIWEEGTWKKYPHQIGLCARLWCIFLMDVWYKRTVVVWMRKVLRSIYIWMLGPCLVELVGKDLEMWPCRRRCVTGAKVWGFKKLVPFPACAPPFSLCLLLVDQSCELPAVSAPCSCFAIMDSKPLKV